MHNLNREKCATCGRLRFEHKAMTFECPVGYRHRTVGYLSFGPNVFKSLEGKILKPKEISAKQKAAMRKACHAVLGNKPPVAQINLFFTAFQAGVDFQKKS